MAISNQTLTTSIAPFFTSTNDNAITCLYFCNVTANTVTFSVYAVPSGATAGNSNCIYNNISLTANDTYVVDMEKLVLSNGDTLQAKASTGSAVVVTTSSMRI